MSYLLLTNGSTHLRLAVNDGSDLLIEYGANTPHGAGPYILQETGTTPPPTDLFMLEDETGYILMEPLPIVGTPARQGPWRPQLFRDFRTGQATFVPRARTSQVAAEIISYGSQSLRTSQLAIEFITVNNAVNLQGYPYAGLYMMPLIIHLNN